MSPHQMSQEHVKSLPQQLLPKPFGWAVALFLLGSMSATLYAQEEDSSEASERLIEKLGEIDTFHAKFTQQIVSNDGTPKETHTGYFALQKPDKLIWAELQPYETFVLIEGETMSVFEPDLEQLTISELDTTNNLSPANLLLATSTELLSGFRVTQDTNRFQLTPVDSVAEFRELVIEFSGDRIKSVSILEHLNSKTKFSFNETKFNQPLEENVFFLDIPPDTEIISQTSSESSSSSE